jgi:Repeat of unknown function (DUF5648)
MHARVIITSSLWLVLSACSSDGNKNHPTGSGGGDAQGGSSGSGTSGRPSGNVGGGAGHTGPMFAGAECPTDLGLPDAYALPNVQGAIEGSNARITFDPQGDALDYRVYALPKSKVSGDTISGAVYRCAGAYEVPRPAIDAAAKPENPGFRTIVQSTVAGQPRVAADATLGYVYTTPAADRLPVYALGDPNLKADNAGCYYMRWPESRVKRYTTSESERTELLAKRWRDDGIVFYVPKPDADGVEPVYFAAQKEDDFSAVLYVKGGPEYDKRVADGLKPTAAFSVYTAAKDGAEPLRRVFYQQTCGRSHDELVAGVARFNKAYEQGSQPVPELHFSGITEETTLVVEALDQQCPYQGALAPTSRPAHVETFGAEMIKYPPFQTPAEVSAAWPSGELFVNGQGEGTKPKAISRACLKVKPEPPPALDFFYDGSPEKYSAPNNTGYQTYEVESPTFNIQFTNVETDSWSIGSLFGELWTTYSDKAADTNGKLRITPKQRATLAADKFVHAVMEVDTVSSQRRYPQLLVSSAEWPVQDNLAKGSTAIVQMFGGVTEALEVQIEFCDHRTWDVNDQCPKLELYTLKGPDGEFIAPAPEINGFQGTDRTVRFDVYVSTSRIYVYTNTQPYGCADLPSGKLAVGNATVTFGDVLYHSAVDLAEWYPFHIAKMQVLTSRHFSNLGFSSGVAEPGWDESRLPCVPASALK